MRKISILLKQRDIIKDKLLLNNLPAPYKFTPRANENKILGHMMTADNSTTHEVNERSINEDIACRTLRNPFTSNANCPVKHSLIPPPHTLVGGVLLYSLQCYEISKQISPASEISIRGVLGELHKAFRNTILLTKELPISLSELRTIYQQLKVNYTI